MPAAPSATAVLVGQGGANVRDRNAVLSGRATSFRCAEAEGALSLKLVTRGEATWTTPDGSLLVHDDSYLILDAEQRYSVDIDSLRPVETLTVWFRANFVEGAVRALTTPAERLLDDPDDPAQRPLFIAQKLHPQGDSIGRALLELHAGLAARRLSPEALEDRFYALAALLGEEQRDVRAAASRLPALKPSTRAELIRRLFRARDFAASAFPTALSTEDMARAACLSTHHFHRLFFQAYGETPHRFLVRRRLDRARKLLLDTELPVGDICLEIGLSSPGSFSSLFRKSFGLSPKQYRDSLSAK